MEEQEFVSPIADWPEAWKERFQVEFEKRLMTAIAEGWNIHWVGPDRKAFIVPDGDPKTSQHIIHLLQETQGYVEWLMSKDN